MSAELRVALARTELTLACFPLLSPAPPSVPTPTYSCHWVRDSQFKQIVSNFLDEEQRQIDYTLEVLEQELSPYKQPAG